MQRTKGKISKYVKEKKKRYFIMYVSIIFIINFCIFRMRVVEMSGRRVTGAEATTPLTAPVSPSNVKVEPDGNHYVYIFK